jgi:chromate transporter
MVFAVITSTAFGGGQKAQIRRQTVTEKRWVTDEDFIDALTACEILPGPNVLNLGVFLAQRARGVMGAIVAFFAIAIPPFVIILVVAWLYFAGINVPFVHPALMGAAAAAVGLTIANALELTAENAKLPVNVVVIAMTVIGVSYFHIHLLYVLVVFGAVSFLAQRLLRHKSAKAA